MKNLDVKKASIVISILMIAIFIFAAPSFVRTTVSSKNKVAYERPFPSVAYGYTLSQEFTPQYDKIESIEIYVNALNCDMTQGAVRVNILDSELLSVYENEILLSELPQYGWLEIVKNLQLQSGDTYYLTIEAVDTVDDGPTFSFYPTGIAAGTEESDCTLYYVGLPLEDSVLKISFRYSVPIVAVEYIVYCLFLLFIVCFLTEKIYIVYTTLPSRV